jgi:hypothetical protein
MKKPNMTTAAAILFAVATAGAGIVGAQELGENNEPHHTPEEREAIHEAIEEGDYSTFVSLVGEGAKILGSINANNFTQLQEIHALREAGNHEEAKALATELGLEHRMKHGEKGERGERPQLSEEVRAAVDAAIEAGNYDAFLAAHGEDSNVAEKVDENKFTEIMANHAERTAKKASVDAAFDARDYDAFVQAVGEEGKRHEQVNESNFAQFAELHDLRESGDHEAAKALAEEMGLEKPDGQKKSGKRGGFGGPGGQL